MNETEKLEAEILQKDLETFRKLETWGSSLFLGAIALLGKQFIEWDKRSDPKETVVLAAWAFTAPAVAGLVAFVFLRIVKFHSYTTATSLRRIVGKLFPSPTTPWGVLGWLFALMPLGLGYAVTWLLASDNEVRSHRLCILAWIGLLFLGAALAFHIVGRARSVRKT